MKEEQIDVNTREVRATKRIVEETKTVEVPVRLEEVVIDRHKLTNGSNSDGIAEDDKIIIPISGEQIEITKHPVVKEEVSINKKEVEDTKQVSETVRKEDIYVETEGNSHVKKENKKKL